MPEDESPFESLATARLFMNEEWRAGLVEDCGTVESGTGAPET